MKRSIFPHLFFLLPFLFSCDTCCINYRQVERIVFYPMPKGIERPYAIIAFLDLKRETRDTSITDINEIKEFCKLLNQLEPEEKLIYTDLRCAAVLKMKSGKDQCFCFGEKSGILLNGCKNLKDYQPVFDYIEEHIYATQPPDYWYSEKTRDIIRWVHSLEEAK